MRLRLAEDDFLFSHRNLHVFAAAVEVRKRDQEAVVLDRILPERWFRYPGLEMDTLMRLRLAEDDFLFSHRNLHVFAAAVQDRKRDQEAVVLDRILPERWFRYPGLEIDTSLRLRLAEDDFLFSHRNLHGFAAAVHVRKGDQEAMVLDRILPERA